MGGNIQAQYKLKVKTDKISYSPGEMINGTFAFEYSEEQAKKKNINIKNPEVTISIFQIEAIRPKKRTNLNNLITQNINIKELLDIKKNPDGIFNFKKEIPLDIQPSFEWPRSEKINASLRTIIQIEIKQVKALGSAYVIIRKNSTPLSAPLEIIEKSHKTGIFSGGDISLKANLQANSYPVYSQIPFQFTVDFSQSKYKIKGINYVLERKIKMFDQKGNVINEYIDSLMESNIKGNMTKLQTENCKVDIRDPIEIHRNYFMKNIVFNGLESNQLITLMPNIKGTLFSCEYYVKCKAITDSLFASSPILYLPLDIFIPTDYNISNIHRESINPNIYDSTEEEAAPNYSFQQQNTPQPPAQEILPSQVIPPSQPEFQPQYQYPTEIITPLGKNLNNKIIPEKNPDEKFDKPPAKNISDEK